jgi:uncharacterized protein YcfL
MKSIFLIALTALIVCGCQNKEKTDSNIIKTIAEDTLSKTVAGTADVSDSPTSDNNAVELIQKQLIVLLKEDLPAIKKKERFFYYEAFDLNNDKKEEYFVGFSNSYFCGSGGCSGYILNNDGSLINSFTITDFPIYITTSSTEKFYDLIFETGGKFYIVKMKDGKYPSNPSLQQELTGRGPKESTKVLDIEGKKLEKYSF